MFDQSEAEVGHRAVGSEDKVAKKADEFEDAVACETVNFYMEPKETWLRTGWKAKVSGGVFVILGKEWSVDKLELSGNVMNPWWVWIGSQTE